MTFNSLNKFFLVCLYLLLVGCSDSENETRLVDLHIVAGQDVIAISFPDDTTETILSVNSEFDFSLQGLKSNGVDLITVSRDVRWSLSAGAVSSIDQQGHFTAGPSAEFLTLTAQFGFLTESIDIMVSSSKFDQVVNLDETPFELDMCRTRTIKPIGRYVDENNNEEIRPVDSTIINTIEWIILNQEDNSDSGRAYFETTNDEVILNALAAGDLIIRARANSLVSNTEVTSVDFNQTVGNTLNSIKLCLSSETDLTSCTETTTASFEKDEVLSLIAVGDFQASDGSNFSENISQRSKWGISNPLNASIAFSVNRQQLDITGLVEDSTATVSAACGEIDQVIDGEDIKLGVTLDSLVSCTSIDCQSTSAFLDIQNLSVLSFSVTANDIQLTDDINVTLPERPVEIILAVTVNLSNGESRVVTSDTSLDYEIINISGQSAVIEEESGSSGVFTVLRAGIAKIQIDYRGESFIARLLVP